MQSTRTLTCICLHFLL